MRTTPVLPDLFRLVTLPDDLPASNEPLSFRQVTWCAKPLPTFSNEKQELLAIIREVMRHFPLLPLEEEGQLNDMLLWENFIEQLSICDCWTRLCTGRQRPVG